ncbi:MAG TPA: hypothetical protein VER36_00670 [Flavisolibacter sp.]|nr:hypothetical protein [Flavisolibacter sp.]
MQTDFSAGNFDEQILRCSKCNWQGKGGDATVIDFYGVTANKEVHCPNCDERLGTVKKDNDPPPGESATDLSFQFG